MLLALWVPLQTSAQLSVAPTSIFIDDRTNASTFFVSNRSDTPQEIRIETLFGYVVSDSVGNRSVAYDDPLGLADRDLSEMVRVFPRQFVLAGNQQRTIRVQVIPPPDMEDGSYFTRLRVISEESGGEVEDLAENLQEGELVTRINYRFEQGFGMAYRRGAVTTGVEIVDLRVVEDDETGISLVTEVNQTGNSSFSGSQRIELLDADGEVIADQRITTGVTVRGFTRARFSREAVPAGTYTARITMESDRADINPANLIQMDPVTYQQTVTIP